MESIPKSVVESRERILFIFALVWTTGTSSTRWFPAGTFWVIHISRRYGWCRQNAYIALRSWLRDYQWSIFVVPIHKTYHEIPRLVMTPWLCKWVTKSRCERPACTGALPGIEIRTMVSICRRRHPSNSKGWAMHVITRKMSWWTSIELNRRSFWLSL
jgi:hypothetical protein